MDITIVNSQSAQEKYLQQDYLAACLEYEQLIQVNPGNKDNYWHLGLILVLLDRAEEAQATWLAGLLDQNENDSKLTQWTLDLVAVLSDEASRQENLENIEVAIRLRQQIQAISPLYINNFLHFIRLNFKDKRFENIDFQDINLNQLFSNHEDTIDLNLLKEIVATLLQFSTDYLFTLAFLAAGLSKFKGSELIPDVTKIILGHAINLGYIHKEFNVAANLCELGLIIDPVHKDLTSYLADFYQESDQYQKAIQAAYQYLNLAENLAEKIDATKTLLKTVVVTGGRWQESCQLFAQQQTLINTLIQEYPLDLNLLQASKLFNSYFFASYFADNPVLNRTTQNNISKICFDNARVQARSCLEKHYLGHQERLKYRHPDRKIRLGYLSFCLRRHSVGWLARALFQHHNHDQYEVYLYCITTPDSQDSLQDWYISQVLRAIKCVDINVLSKTIFEDEIDILIELDSITVDTTCSVVMLKPAPIQVTWLGWDASGIPTIDYFIADNHVLPANAQDYYHEKIVRLPQSYIACDGFEVGLPTLRREDLGVPAEAIAYYSVQKGYKRHPDTMRLQLEIIKAVPGSYFLIKGSNDTEDMERAFLNLADEVGVERDRLKFLAVDYSEPTHRANMLIADIVLDTYPYNGATTTMETLWMGIPLVTWVGEQFAARNSYTMLINAGITEGIAHNAEEYVQWGIRYGTDPQLRHGVNRKLQTARRTAPLWNGRQFARHMEAAYEQMWADYVGEE